MALHKDNPLSVSRRGHLKAVEALAVFKPSMSQNPPGSQAFTAHDLRQPVSTILLYSHMLIEETATTISAEHRAMLECIRNSCNQMIGLLNVLSAAGNGCCCQEILNLQFALQGTMMKRVIAKHARASDTT
jgi:hypothetical protein